MRYLFLFLLFPLIAFSQPMKWQSCGIPVEQDERMLPLPWLGGEEHSSLAFCDINNDSLTDVIIGCRSNVWLLLNIGLSGFQNFNFIDLELDSLSYSYFLFPAVCDIDADDDLDLFIADWENYTTKFYINNGDRFNPNFQFVTDSIEGLSITGYLDFKDMDDDNDNDIVISGEAGRLEYYENIGNCQVYSFQIIDTIYQVTYSKPSLGDLDCDGDYDLIFGSLDGSIYYLRNNGTPSQYDYTLVTNNIVPDPGSETTPSLVDIDGDGDLDMFVGTGETGSWTPFGGTRYYENIGTPQEYNFILRTSSYFDIDCGTISVPRLVDIDGDSDKDLFVGKMSNGMAFYRNAGTNINPIFTLEEECYQNLQIAVNCSPEFCDFDGDGDYDMLVGLDTDVTTAFIRFYENIGSPDSAIFESLWPEEIELGDDCANPSPAICDIDSDGDYDLFVGTYDGNILFYMNYGNRFHPNWILELEYFSSIDVGHSAKPFFFDIDNDGDFDLFVGCSSTTYGIYYYENIGNQQVCNYVLRSSCWENVETFSGITAPCLADIDADGDGDLYLGCRNGGVAFYRNMQYNSVSHQILPLPYSFTLEPCFPNPFNPSTIISYNLPEISQVKIEVYNILGRKVAVLMDGLQSAGIQKLDWNTSPLSLSSGIYFCRMTATGKQSGKTYDRTQKMMLLK